MRPLPKSCFLILLTYFTVKTLVERPNLQPAQKDTSTWQTFRVKWDQAVTEWPLFHRLIEYDVLWKDDHCDVLKLAKTLQDLSHGFGLGFLHHTANPHHDLTLWRLKRKSKNLNKTYWYLPKHVKLCIKTACEWPYLCTDVEKNTSGVFKHFWRIPGTTWDILHNKNSHELYQNLVYLYQAVWHCKGID